LDNIHLCTETNYANVVGSGEGQRQESALAASSRSSARLSSISISECPKLMAVIHASSKSAELT
jgi:hypothetical protein